MASFMSEKTKALEQGKNQFSQSFYKAMETPVKDGDSAFQHCVLERHEDTMSFPLLSFFGVRPLATYSMRFKLANHNPDEAMPEGETRLWARRQIFAKKAYYIFSAHPEDLTCSESERSEFFLGTMKKKFEGRMFKGFTKEDGDMKCVVMYDHERSSVDNKMEVAVPRDSTKPFPSLLDKFSKIRQEGSANHSSTRDIIVYHENISDRNKAKNGESIQGETNAHISVKNFQLVKSKPHQRFTSMYAKAATEEIEGGDSQIPAQTIPDAYEESDEEKDGNDICFQMIKLDKDTFDCKYKAPFTLLQAFQICLSRFETQQVF